MNRSTIGYSVMVLAAVVAGIYLLPSRPLSDVELGRAIFTGLARGSRAVQEQIDWAHLSALDIDVGSAYTMLKTDLDRSRYCDTFVVGFSQGFRHSGASTRSFVNWRMQARDGANVTVAVDDAKHHKTLLLVLGPSSDGTMRLQAIRWSDAS